MSGLGDIEMTIIEAVKTVLDGNKAMGSKEIYEKIIEQNLYEFPAKNPHAVVNGMIRRHCLELDFPTSSPIKYFRIASKDGKKLKYCLLDEKQKVGDSGNAQNSHGQNEMLPEEKIVNAHQEHLNELYASLLSSILDKHSSFFEQLIVDLLLKMGYGYGSDSGITVGGPHDGGIDGIISEDKLGLDLIYLQAKRYKESQKVGSKDLQVFVGAMKNVQKGVFITTSSFTREAMKFVEEQQQKNLKIIDGKLLAELMVKYEVGVKVQQSFHVYKPDISYFE